MTSIVKVTWIYLYGDHLGLEEKEKKRKEKKR